MKTLDGALVGPLTVTKPVRWETNGQKYAVTFKDPEGIDVLIGMFDCLYWAELFMAGQPGKSDSFKIVEVAHAL